MYCFHSDNGACLTLSELGLLRYDEQKLLDPVVYTSAWDAQYVQYTMLCTVL